MIRDKCALLALSSPDRVSWQLMREEPILTDYPFASLNLAFWDTWRSEYVAYCRGVAGQGTSDFSGGVRWICRGTSRYSLNWGPLENINCGHTPWEHLYTKFVYPIPTRSGNLSHVVPPCSYTIERPTLTGRTTLA